MESKAIEVLREFVADIEAVGVKQTAEDWPDLVITYRKAKKALAEESEPAWPALQSPKDAQGNYIDDPHYANVYARHPHRDS